jgi:hypothetical protein
MRSRAPRIQRSQHFTNRFVEPRQAFERRLRVVRGRGYFLARSDKRLWGVRVRDAVDGYSLS